MSDEMRCMEGVGGWYCGGAGCAGHPNQKSPVGDLYKRYHLTAAGVFVLRLIVASSLEGSSAAIGGMLPDAGNAWKVLGILDANDKPTSLADVILRAYDAGDEYVKRDGVSLVANGPARHVLP